MATAEILVGIAHGDGCICTPLKTVEVKASVDTVIINATCPAAANGTKPVELDYSALESAARLGLPPQTSVRKEIAGRVIITWPSRGPAVALDSWHVAIQDADTGEQFVDVIALQMSLGEGGWGKEAITVDLTRLIDKAGQPIGAGSANAAIIKADSGEPEMRTGVFRYLVAEMRVSTPAEASGLERLKRFYVESGHERLDYDTVAYVLGGGTWTRSDDSGRSTASQ